MKLKTTKPGRMYPATNLAPHISRDTGRDPRLAVREKAFLYTYIKGRTNKKPHGVVAHSIRQADRNPQTIALCFLYYSTNKGAEQHQTQNKRKCDFNEKRYFQMLQHFR